MLESTMDVLSIPKPIMEIALGTVGMIVIVFVHGTGPAIGGKHAQRDREYCLGSQNPSRLPFRRNQLLVGRSLRRAAVDEVWFEVIPVARIGGRVTR